MTIDRDYFLMFLSFWFLLVKDFFHRIHNCKETQIVFWGSQLRKNAFTDHFKPLQSNRITVWLQQKEWKFPQHMQTQSSCSLVTGKPYITESCKAHIFNHLFVFQNCRCMLHDRKNTSKVLPHFELPVVQMLAMMKRVALKKK